jgi:dihydrofolate reductase
MTQRVSDYENDAVPGQLEFSDDSPALVVENLANEGYDEMLLVGGAHVATSFLKENLIDEIILTIEPRIFGSGGNFVVDKNLDAYLQLVELQKINDSGTLILKYQVLKPLA